MPLSYKTSHTSESDFVQNKGGTTLHTLAQSSREENFEPKKSDLREIGHQNKNGQTNV